MAAQNAPSPLFSEQDLFGQGKDPEFELAFMLQNREAGDPRLLDALIQHYAADVCRLACALLDHHREAGLLAFEVRSLVEQTFDTAMATVARFWGQPNIRHWLYGITIHLFRAGRFERRLRRWRDWLSPARSPFHTRDKIATDQPSEAPWFAFRLPSQPGENEEKRWAKVDTLPETQRLAVILYYVCDLPLPEIAQLLDTSPASIEARLAAARNNLLAEIAHEETTNPQSASQTRTRDAQLSEVLQKRWPRPELVASQLERLREAVSATIPEPRPLRHLLRPLWGSVAAGVLLAIFVALFWILNRGDLGRVETRLRATPTSTQLPNPIGISAPLEAGANQAASEGGSDHIFNMEPAISSDGRWVVFTSSAISLVEGDTNNYSDIFVYDIEKRTLERVNLASDGSQANGWSATPSISANGRWVVFVSTADNLGGEQPSVGKGIYLHDRQTGQTMRVDQRAGEKAASADSFMPSLSADGRWVAYWSQSEQIHACGEIPQEQSCLDIYLYDRENETTVHLSVGRPETQIHQDTRLALSADGRYMAFTLYTGDHLAHPELLSHVADVFVFDWHTGALTSVNVTSDGLPGNGHSYAPNISADGRIVAFASTSSNLVSDDTNNSSDVFVRDLLAGNIERVSVTSDGAQEKGDSGPSYPGMEAWRDNVALSADGRFVAFLLSHGTLQQGTLDYCWSPTEEGCNSFYVHDRQTDRTERITAPLSDRTYLFATFSGEGRWVAYVQLMNDCPVQPLMACSEVYLHDRLSGWITAVTPAKNASTDTSWLPLNDLAGLFLTSGLAFSPDGHLLATGSDGDVRLWHAGDGSEAGSLETPISADESPPEVTSLTFSPNGRMLAAGFSNGNVYLWRVADHQLRYVLKEHPGEVIHVAFMPNDETLLAATPQAVWVWESLDNTYARTKEFEYPSGFISDIALSPSGHYLAIAASDETVWLQQTASGDVFLRLGGHAAKVTSVAFSPDGSYLAAGDLNGSVNLWQVEEYASGVIVARYLKTLHHTRQVHTLTFSPDGNSLAGGNSSDGAHFWSMPDGTPLDSLPAEELTRIREMTFSPGGQRLAALSISGTASLWRNAATVEEPRFFIQLQSDQGYMATNDTATSGQEEIESFRSMSGYDFLALHTLAETVNFEIGAPTLLPPGWIFGGARLTSSGAVVSRYELPSTNSQDPAAEIYLVQRHWSSEVSPIPVGASAAIERVKVKGQYGEHVVGDWHNVYRQSAGSAEGSSSTTYLGWDADLPVQQLRWQAGPVVYFLYYRLAEENASGYAALTGSDLAAIGRSITALSLSPDIHSILAYYVVKPGDTCSAIAHRFGTSVEAIARLNSLPNNCNLIYAGQTLVVALPFLRETIAEGDLNCDGHPERLTIIPVPSEPDGDFNFGVVLETSQPNGFYRESGRYTIAETLAEYFSRPQLFSVGGCEQLLAINVIGGPEADAGLKVFGWYEGAAVLLLAADGWAEEGIQPEGEHTVITTHRLEADAATGMCTRTTTRYAWNGVTFIEEGETVETGVKCGGKPPGYMGELPN